MEPDYLLHWLKKTKTHCVICWLAACLRSADAGILGLLYCFLSYYEKGENFGYLSTCASPSFLCNVHHLQVGFTFVQGNTVLNKRKNQYRVILVGSVYQKRYSNVPVAEIVKNQVHSNLGVINVTWFKASRKWLLEHIVNVTLLGY